MARDCIATAKRGQGKGFVALGIKLIFEISSKPLPGSG